MPLDGLRAWIGEVERKLGMRTRVFLALGAIAIGIGGAAMYLAIDTRSSAVSESDVRALQEEMEARLGAGGGVTQLEAELRALQAEVEQLRGNRGTGGNGGGGAGRGGGAGPGAGGAGDGTGGSGPGGGGASAGGASDLQDLLEQAQKRNEELE